MRGRPHPALAGGLLAAALLAAALGLGVPAPASALMDRVEAEHGVAAGGDIAVGRDLTIGLTPAQVKEAMRAYFAEESAAVAKVEELSARLGVTRGAVAGFFRILGEREVPTEELAAKLAEIAERHKALLAQLQAFDAEDPEIRALQEQARAAIEEGAYDRAEALLGQIREAELAAARRLQETARRAQEAADARLLNAAAATAEQGDVRLVQLDYAGAAELFEQAADLVPASSPLVRADYLNRFGEAALRAGDYSVAEEALEEALKLRQTGLESDDPDVGESLNNLAALYEAQGRYGEAEPLYRRALAIGEATLGPDHPHVATALNNLAGLRYGQGQHEEAETLLKRALDIFKRRLGPDHPLTVQARQNYEYVRDNRGE